ncbi:hypothetical protein FGO68_gene1450 [Halteria grandinella]|uniref:Uncharacterized protein n=1 Tax=Halteria grandinella TaxID=5974 RepID=A0A8J8NB05_HALGN|nr:hypothetical protein FGO68_gene1450 [Halteria grandinella]
MDPTYETNKLILPEKLQKIIPDDSNFMIKFSETLQMGRQIFISESRYSIYLQFNYQRQRHHWFDGFFYGNIYCDRISLNDES